MVGLTIVPIFIWPWAVTLRAAANSSMGRRGSAEAEIAHGVQFAAAVRNQKSPLHVAAGKDRQIARSVPAEGPGLTIESCRLQIP